MDKLEFEKRRAAIKRRVANKWHRDREFQAKVEALCREYNKEIELITEKRHYEKDGMLYEYHIVTAVKLNMS